MAVNHTRRGSIRWGLYVLTSAIDRPVAYWPDEEIAEYLAEAYADGSREQRLKLMDDARRMASTFQTENLVRLLERDPDLAAITLLYISRFRPCERRREVLLDYETLGRPYGQREISAAARTILDREGG